MTLHVRTESAADERRTVIHVAGDVDLETADGLRAALKAAPPQQPGHELVVDLAEVPFLDSSGVQVLLEARMTALAGGGALVVRNPSRMVARVLEVTGVAAILGLPSGPPPGSGG